MTDDNLYPMNDEWTECNHIISIFSYKTSLSSQSSSSSSPSSTRRPKGGLNSNNNGGGNNKNKLLRNENKARFDNKDDNMQLVANPSSYWSTNDNVKRSSISQQTDQQFNESPDVSMKDYYADMPAPNPSTDEMIYFDEDGDENDYDINAYFNRINQDNINDFYYEINQLLSRKPIQK